MSEFEATTTTTSTRRRPALADISNTQPSVANGTNKLTANTTNAVDDSKPQTLTRTRSTVSLFNSITFLFQTRL